MQTQTIRPVPIRTVVWKKGYDPPTYRDASTYWVFGKRYAGKSSLLEAVATQYLANGSTIFDLFGARDSESLAWLRSPYRKVLLICGDKVKLNTTFEWRKVSDFNLKEAEEYQIVVTTPRLYASEYEQYSSLSHLLDILKWRDHWSKVDVLLVREASRLITSRIIAGKVKNRMEAEYDFIDLHNESYHTGLAACIDSLRPMSIDTNVRDIANYIFIKRLGRMTIPREYYHLLQHYRPESIRKMAKDTFVLYTDNNAVASGIFEKVPWHVERGEDILSSLKIGIEIEKAKEKEPEVKPEPVEGVSNHLTIQDLRNQHKSWAEIERDSGISRSVIYKHSKGLCDCGIGRIG